LIYNVVRQKYFAFKAFLWICFKIFTKTLELALGNLMKTSRRNNQFG